MRRLIRSVVCLYPARWRHRYGDEFVSLLDELEPGWRQLFDVFQGAIVMHLRSIRPSALAGSLGRNVVTFVVFWLISATFIQIGERLLGGWPASTLGELVGLVLGVALALRLRAKVMAYFLTAMTAYSASLNAIHLLYGIRAAQGAPTHNAVMGAGLIGVILGALLATHYRRSNGLGEALAGTHGDSTAGGPEGPPLRGKGRGPGRSAPHLVLSRAATPLVAPEPLLQRFQVRQQRAGF